MTNKISTNKHGFTIIEVVLVLAIAGLIFLMVFVALPALQRSQRDTQRKNDVGRMVTALTTYYSNKGSMPNDKADFSDLNDYLGDFKDPGTGATYVGSVASLSSSQTGQEIAAISGKVPTITVYKNAKCNSDNKADYKSGGSYFAVVAKIESGALYCQDNS